LQVPPEITPLKRNQQMTSIKPAKAFLAEFASWAAKRPDDFSDDASMQARLSLLDTLACMKAGWTEPQTLKVAKAINLNIGADMPVNPFHSAMQTASSAALLLGTAAHALDFDDYELIASTHPSAVLVSALLAMAKQCNSTLGEFLQAYLVGYELIARCGENLGYGHYQRGWHATSTLGNLGAAAATAYLLRLDARSMVSAVSLATSMSAGLKVQFGSSAKAVHAGLAAQAGVQAALLAASGIEARADVLEVEGGFFDLYSGTDNRNLPVAKKPGYATCWCPIVRKPWPCCAYAHRSIEAAITLAEKLGPEVAAISSAVIHIPAPYAEVVAVDNPATGNDARFSLVFCTAAALLDGEVSPASFNLAALARTDIRDLMQRLSIDAYAPEDDIDDISPVFPETLSIKLTDGRELKHSVADVLGGATRPMSQAQLETKFIACGGIDDIASHILSEAPSEPVHLDDILEWLVFSTTD
jgi:2-methylcitrate dehydratase PrpD